MLQVFIEREHLPNKFQILCVSTGDWGLRVDGVLDAGRITRGVAKLGFSWEALDVKYWAGPASMTREFRLQSLALFLWKFLKFTRTATSGIAIILP